MHQRIKTLWLPSLVSVSGAMAWRLVLQQTVLPSETLLNHAGLPLRQQLLWLGGLPFFGAASAYLSCITGGRRSSRLMAAISPAIVMMLLWGGLATRMSHPSPSQWLGLLSGILNWVVTPAVALLFGALPFIAPPTTWKARINDRTRTFWVPALVSLIAALMGLTTFTIASLRPAIVAHGWTFLVGYILWILCLPLCGAAGAYISRRAGGTVWTRLATVLFPVVAMSLLVGVLIITKRVVFAKPQIFYFASALFFGAIVPSAALFAGALPFLKSPEDQHV